MPLAPHIARTAAASVAHPFRFLVCDWMTGVVLAELPLVNGSFERRLNGTGFFTAELPLGDPRVTALDPYTSTQPSRTHLYVDLDGVLLWAGMIWARRYDSKSKRLQLQGSETMSYFAHRLWQWPTQVYTNVDQGAIVSDLLTRALAGSGTTPASFSLNINIATGIVRTQTYNPWEYRQILQEISTMQAMDQGFDFATDLGYVGGVPHVTFTLSYPRRGLTYAASGLMFEYPGNILSYTWPEDGASAANVCWGIGAGSGATTLTAYAINSGLVVSGGYPYLERVGSYKTIVDAPALQAKVAQDLITYQNDRMAPPGTKWQGSGLIVPTVEVLANADPVVGSYTVGDESRLRITDERFPAQGTVGAGIDTAYRIVAYTLKLGDVGTPSTSTLALGPAL